MLLCYNPPAISAPPYYTMTLYDKMKNTKAPSPCVSPTKKFAAENSISYSGMMEGEKNV